MTQHIILQLHATNLDALPPDLILMTSSVNTFSALDEDAQTAFGDDVLELENQGWKVLKDSLSTSTDTAITKGGVGCAVTAAMQAAAMLLEACQAVRLPICRVHTSSI